jgi:uncharacterized protein YrrD
MLQLSNALIDRPIMSLRTGSEVATAIGPIVNPNNLKIEGFYCSDPTQRSQNLVLVAQDIRDIIPQGIVINDHDVLSDPADLVRLKPVMSLQFGLLGKRVETASGEKVGKIEDYAIDMDSMFIQKLYVSQSVFKSFSGGNLGIDRSQIVEITPKKVVVHDLLGKVPAGAKAIA